MSTGIDTIQAANNGITAITKLVQSAQALVSQANQTADVNVRATLAAQFNALLPQIDQLAGDSGFNGVNLLGGNDLTITMNEDGTSTVVVGSVNDTTAGDLAINTSANNWATGTDIAAAGTQLSAALTTLRSQAQSLSSNLSTVQIRQDFTKAMINTLNNGATVSRLPTATRRAPTCSPCKPGSNRRPQLLSLAAQADLKTCCAPSSSWGLAWDGGGRSSFAVSGSNREPHRTAHNGPKVELKGGERSSFWAIASSRTASNATRLMIEATRPSCAKRTS